MRTTTCIAAALALLLLYACRLSAQEVPEELRTGYGPLDERLARMVTVDSLSLSPAQAREMRNAVYLDAREPEEYAVSHLPQALSLGYDRPDYSILDDMDRNTPLVVYCTVGYRSERMVKELKSRGFSQVYNLYGSIYAWILAGNPVYDENGVTDNLHTYNRKWGTYFPDNRVHKVY